MEADPDSRQYNPIWKTLKANNRVSITAPRPLHKRIIKAVKKEKWLDVGYKLTIEPRKATLSHTRCGSILTFYLEFNLIAEDF